MGHVGAINRWDVFWADLEPHVGSEQAGKRRPVLVVSNDGFNKRFPVFTIVPLTKLEGKTRKIYPSEVILPTSAVGNRFTPVAQAFHLRTISPLRLLAPAGRLEDDTIRRKVNRHSWPISELLCSRSEVPFLHQRRTSQHHRTHLIPRG